MSFIASMPALLFQDEARLEYGRMLWKKPLLRERLLRHWLDPRHPWSARFSRKWKPWVEKLLASSSHDAETLDAELRKNGLSLRVVVKEIPPVFGSFY